MEEISREDIHYDKYGSGKVTIPCPDDDCKHSSTSLSNMTVEELIDKGEITCNVCGVTYQFGGLYLE